MRFQSLSVDVHHDNRNISRSNNIVGSLSKWLPVEEVVASIDNQTEGNIQSLGGNLVDRSVATIVHLHRVYTCRIV